MPATLITLATATHIELIYRVINNFWPHLVASPVGTTKPLLHICISGFCVFATPSVTVIERIKRKFNLFLNPDMPDYPYKLSRLANDHHPICSDPNKRWYIVFWVWDSEKGKLTRCRDWTVNKYTTVKDRYNYAKQLMRTIDKLLVAGNTINMRAIAEIKAKQISYDKDIKLVKGLRLALIFKQGETRKSTAQNIESILTVFEEFVDIQQWGDLYARSITQRDIRMFLDHVSAKGLSNTTRNSYMGKMSTLFSALRSREIIPVNPCEGISLLNEETGRNWAFTEEQVAQLKPVIIAKHPELWDFIQFMVYGFIRPNEIRQLRVNTTDLVNNKIFIAGNISKNRKSAHVKVSSKFRPTIEKLTASRPMNAYIFENPKKGGMLPENLMSTWHLEILRELGYSADYTLYSWKHTGVIMHYRAGVDIKSLQEQLRHSSLTETDTYLKSLGLFTNTEIEDKSPAI